MILWRPTRHSRTNTPKRCPFHDRGLECKSRKSRNTWSNRQIQPWSTEWSRAKANKVLPRERTAHSKHPLPTTQEKTLHMDIARWSTPKSDGLHSLEEMATLSSVLAWRIPGTGEPGGLPPVGSHRVGHDWSYLAAAAAKDGEALYSQQKQDQELTVAQIMNSLLPNSDLNWRK